MRAVLVQLVGLHAPSELTVCSIAGGGWSQELAWLKWLPHVGSAHSPLEGPHLADSAATGQLLLGSLEGLIQSRKSKASDRGAQEETASVALSASTPTDKKRELPQLPAVVVLVADDSPVDRGRLVQLAEAGPDAGVYVIWISPTLENLPAACRTYIDTGDDRARATVGHVRLGTRVEDVASEGLSLEAALTFARHLSPIVEEGPLAEDSSDLPQRVSMLSLIGRELADSSSAIVDRWTQNDSIHDRVSIEPQQRTKPGKLRALVGQAGLDALHLDLRTQGPHALVGGTTGAGKSEFLQAWVLGMAMEYSPDRVTFLFVDYKGGSAFADCVDLPHTVGLVTDLSPHLVRRALTSLRAELHHREHLLNRKKAKDLLELERRGDPDSPPALILVIDEFAALAKEVPDFVDGVVDIAQRGRSLGIHLIMATQRPAGVIKDNLRANTNMRIALRMADEGDSQDVIGDKQAAFFDPSLPGRGVAKTGPGRLVPFQSAYAGGWTREERPRATVAIADLRFGTDLPWAEAEVPEEAIPEDPGPTDQQRMVRTAGQAAREAAIPPAVAR